MHNKKYIPLILFFTIFGALVNADSILIHNTIDEDIYVATYYTSDKTERICGPIKIPANSSIQIERGERKSATSGAINFFIDRELFFDADEETLKDSLDARARNRLFHTNVGNKYGQVYYIRRDNELLTCYSSVVWRLRESIANPVKTKFTSAKKRLTKSLKERILRESPVISNNPYKNTLAYVRTGNNLPESEQSYLKKRKQKAQKALEKFLGHPLSEHAVPTIALLESGGGYRAMTSSVGFHAGLDAIGLMDATTYMVGVSGSTWSIALWLHHKMAIQTFRDHMAQLAQKGLSDIKKEEVALIAHALSVKYSLDQELTLVDTFGAYLANVLLRDNGDDRQSMRLSEQAALLENAHYPCPIYTAVRTDHAVLQDWYEFTPWECGAPWLGGYIPTWAYGRKFMNGVSVDFAPEQSLGYFMGTWGSAFAASLERIYKEVKREMPHGNIIDRCVNGIVDAYGHHHLTAAHINNFTQGIANCAFKNYHTLKLGDGGQESNLPFAAVSGERPERKADIMIFFDADDDLSKKELSKVEKYARKNGLKFPVINYETIDKKTISIFKDESDHDVPLVIYMPLLLEQQLLEKAKEDPQYASLIPLLEHLNLSQVAKEGYARTTNFCYKEEETKQMSSVMEFNVRMVADQIREAIEWKIGQR